MKQFLAIAILLLSSIPAWAGTLTITASGFSNTPVSAPANWPAGITWPGNQVTNGTKTFTVSDADWVALITWTAAATITPNTTTPPTPTAVQLLLNWLQIWANGTKQAVQQFFTASPTPPAQISIQ